MWLNAFVVLILIFNLKTSFSQDIVGCGGFVKSDITINYSLVEVKLYTKQGVLKYQTDCAPNNGYYLIPLYDKGEYILKVEPPSGWSFEPSSIELNVDGKNDPCSKSEDLNFIFEGFSISGKVVSKGLNDGPAGVTVFLKDKDSFKPITSTITKEGGKYNFNAVAPGPYLLEATHSDWMISKPVVTINVQDNLLSVKEDFVVVGYNVKGNVISNEDPIKGVHFILFSEDGGKKQLSGCDPAIPEGFVATNKKNPLCHVVSNAQGVFVFKTLPPGSYQILPFYKGQNIKFDVKPSSMSFKVLHKDVQLNDVFQVQGFSVSGKVLTKINGHGVVKANVLVTSETDSSVSHKTQTDNNGVYHLVNMKVGMYKIVVSSVAEDLLFPPLVVKVTPNTPQLPDVIASGFKICGKISLKKSSVDVSSIIAVLIEQKGKPGKGNKLPVKSNGEFCSVVKAGHYLVKPLILDQTYNLNFNPAQKEVIIEDEAKFNIMFNQHLASIDGSISCIESCPDLKIIVRDSDKNAIESKIVKNGKFKINELLSGDYNINIVHEGWCWAEETIHVKVDYNAVNKVSFKQTGFLVTIWTSHEAEIDCKLKKEAPLSFKLKRGTNTYCLKKSGLYDLNVRSCHEFGRESYQYDTSNPSVITFTAMKHQITGLISSDTKTNDMIVTITQPEHQPYVSPVKLIKEGKNGLPNIYQFKFSAYPNQNVKVSPSSKTLLFYPQDNEILTTDDCIMDAISFDGRKGLFINGQVTPPLAGVKVTVADIDGKRNPIILETDSKGKYNLGPLDSLTKYSVNAEKSGYVLEAVKDKYGFFEAFKLAEIKVMVTNEKGQTLSGVLLSLSGGIDYRHNNVTGEDGSMTFSNLSPGMYFLRPMLKEYRFEPVSKMFNITEGSTVQFTVIAMRVAYSCFGKVISLTGESESGVALEAVGLESKGGNKLDVNCAQLQEDSVSESDGTFRIRGLMPGCDYKLQLKNDSESNTHIERASPQYKLIKIANQDLVDVKMIVFRHFQHMEVTANIITAPEYLNTLKVKLFKEDNPDQGINTINVGASSFFQLSSLPIDDTGYILRLETNLPRNTYETDSKSMPEIYFKANTSYRHLVINFQPKVRQLDQEMIGQGNLFAFPLTIFVIFLLYNYSKIVPFLTQANVIVHKFMNPNQIAENSNIDSMAGKRKFKVRKAL